MVRYWDILVRYGVIVLFYIILIALSSQPNNKVSSDFMFKVSLKFNFNFDSKRSIKIIKIIK